MRNRGEAEKYVAKYREQSARCVAVVEESVRVASQNGKRKVVPGGVDPKKLKIWMGKGKWMRVIVIAMIVDMEFLGGASSETGSEEEKEVVLQQNSKSCGEDAPTMVEADAIAGSEAAQADGMLEYMELKRKIQWKYLVKIPVFYLQKMEELEVLGLERLNSELHERKLKCGSTLQERAASLFLLKFTPFDKLPKKLLAKK
ncbi:hypothetical protein F3Y22_tig00013680pilonHSYRG00103 [Hibiscus syriacus]|uniref:SDE2/SF3A3 SAP domain-containing protein n=1 Tax=Hibiscus syriacus TaxID=106335 RepID=A0A6A3C1L8_HIBSY|nr:hypothetical protein F3Y22_tig00013680pilonHSYRG00103 [Hibiscus syriacus]